MNKKMMRAAVAIMMTIGALLPAKAQQQLPQEPLDTAIVTGVLDNGLTYYIRHNENPKGQADFYIAQKVGSILEDDNQRGLAHFLEHMCFNGTKNFPDKNIINWLESVGVKFGYNLNARTGIDETIYNISSVPVARKSVQDSCLLILHDWSCDVTLDPKEIDAERGVIHEEWRQSMVGSMRIIEKLMPKVYPDNKYGERLPIGTMEVVDNFPPQAIVDYYHKWYRPDQQAIIVVGDIDTKYIESKIKEIFSPIKMPENPAERVYVEVDDTPGTIYAIGSDTEMQVPDVMMMFKSDDALLPREYRNTPAYYAMDYISDLVAQMLNQRLSDFANTPECLYANANVGIGEFFLAKIKGALTLDVIAKGPEVIKAFEQAYRELLRAKLGFTVGEYERAKAEYLSRLEKAYNDRNDRQTGSYSEEIVTHFVDNLPMPGIEREKAMYEQMAAAIPLEQINQYLPGLIGEDNRVLMALLPEREGFTVPSEEQFASAISAVEAETLEPYKDQMREDPLIPSLPKPGKVVKTETNKQWEATEYTLSNGVKVIVKPTDFKANEIYFEAAAKGAGMSEVDPAKAPSVKYAPYALQNEALNDYSNSDLKKYLQGKQVAIGFSAGDYTRGMEGNTTVKDLPTLMELIYAYFTGFDLKEDEYNANRDALAGILATQETNPQFVFQADLLDALYETPAKKMISSADVKAADRQSIVDMTRAALANAADYTFVFVGNIDLTTFVPLMEQYIATLPADAKKVVNTYKNNPAFETRPGTETNNYTTKMETPQTWAAIVISGNMPFTPKNKITASVAAQIMSKRLLNKVREEMGATYSIGAQGDMDRTDKVNTNFVIAFPMNPEFKDAALDEIHKIAQAMTSTVTPEELNPVIEYMLKNAEKDRTENDAWGGHITATLTNGVDVFNGRAEVIKSITIADVQNFMKQLLDQNNYRVVLLDPEK